MSSCISDFKTANTNDTNEAALLGVEFFISLFPKIEIMVVFVNYQPTVRFANQYILDPYI